MGDVPHVHAAVTIGEPTGVVVVPAVAFPTAVAAVGEGGVRHPIPQATAPAARNTSDTRDAMAVLRPLAFENQSRFDVVISSRVNISEESIRNRLP